MKIFNVKNYDEMSKKAAAIIAAQIVNKPASVLGLATGSTPIGTYQYLVKKYQEGELDFTEIKTANLDEYKGLNKENDQSYYYFMNDHLFRHVNIKPEHTNIPDGMAENGEAECRRYEEVIQTLGGVDLQLLGLGHDGHIGFNEPEESFPNNTHCVNLTEMTIDANKRFFTSADEVPKQAFTMGIGTIMRAKKVVMVVSGQDKASILKKTLYGPVTPQVPASILQFHPDVIVIADEAALSEC